MESLLLIYIILVVWFTKIKLWYNPDNHTCDPKMESVRLLMLCMQNITNNFNVRPVTLGVQVAVPSTRTPVEHRMRLAVCTEDSSVVLVQDVPGH